MDKEICIIIPTYNERDNIVPIVERVHQSLQGHDYEIVFVDDNSQDGTGGEISKLTSQYPVRLLVRTDERGLASAVAYGITQTNAPIIGVMDADLQHPPEVLPELLGQLAAGADVVIASRYVTKGALEEWSLVRRLISRGAMILAHVLLPQTRRVADAMSGFFMFYRKGITGVSLKPIGFKILLEILVMGSFHNPAEVPYVFEYRTQGESKLRFTQQIEYLRHLLSLMWRSGELKRFLKFCLVGLSGVGVNLGILALLKELVGLHYLLSAAISIEVSIISNFVLNEHFTFADRRQPGSRAFLRRLGMFNIISLAGLGINLAVLWLFTDVIGIYYIVSEIFGIIAATLWNYMVNTAFTWR